jgi:hypothetical protein
MSENQPTNTNTNAPNPGPNPQNSNGQPVQPANYFDERDQWRAQRREWREERRANRRGNGAWIGGAVLIALGLIFLLQNTGLFVLHNWWAIFILIPAIGCFGATYTMYRNSANRLTYPARGSLIAGVVFTLIAAAFLFDVNFGLFWPVLLILAGIGLLLNFVLPS